MAGAAWDGRARAAVLIVAWVAASGVASAGPASPPGEGGPAASIPLPAGHVLLVRFTDAGAVVSAVPAVPAGAPLSTDVPAPTADCHNDVPGSGIATRYPLAPNLLAPLVQNRASQGQCAPPPQGEPRLGPVTLLQFRTAGDWWGGAELVGTGEGGAPGSFLVVCKPAGAGGGVGAAGLFLHYGQVDDAMCSYEERGVSPSQYTTWSGYVYNAHYLGGTATAAVN